MKQVADLKKAGTLTQYKARVFKAKPQATAAPAPLVMPEPTKVAAPAQPITGHVTTERTGKRHKLNRVYAWSMLAVSVLMLVLVGSISSGNDLTFYSTSLGIDSATGQFGVVRVIIILT